MSKEKKIIWSRKGVPEQWGTQHWSLNDEDVQLIKRIEKRYNRALNDIEIPLTEDALEKIEQAIIRYFYQTRHLKAMPTIPERRKLMENLKNSAEAFRLSLNDIRDTKIKRTIPISNELKSEQKIKSLMNTVDEWGKAASKAVPATKTGPKQNTFLIELIFVLIRIYEDSTGEEVQPGYYNKAENEIRGEFAKFAAKIIEAANPIRFWSDQTLVDPIIKEAIIKLKSTETPNI